MSQPRFPIRRKLTIGALVPLFVAILVCWLTGLYVIGSRLVSQAQDKVRTDLNSAREVYRNEMEHILDVVRFTGRSPHTGAALTSSDSSGLKGLLDQLLQNEQLDFLNIVDPGGRIVYRAGNPGQQGLYRWTHRLVPLALKGHDVSGTLVIPQEEILLENPRLAARVGIRVQATPRSRPYQREVEQSGMFLVAAAPIRDGSGTVVGALYGGILLNNNNRVVDKIKRIVYEQMQFEGRDAGSATIFLHDLRIATNVTAPAGERAIGTLMSEEVHQRVLVNRQKWVGRAFVVNDWYYSAYEPILDLDGQPVGSLYVGMLEKPFELIKSRLNLIYAGVLVFGSLIGIILSWQISSRLARPIRQLENLARRVSAGERGVRIDISSHDEIGQLAGELNEMTRALTQREEEIGELNRGLETKVRERTAELEEKNLLLVKTQQELVRAEKLAAVGELAAGVAHEINNPMAIIRGNAELLQIELPPDNPNREEVEIIMRQVSRIERIVSNLLRFARREHRQIARVDINGMLDEILRQIGHQTPLAGITIQRNYAAEFPLLEGDADQLRQVFINLVLNGVQAMKDGGILTVATALAAGGRMQVSISDTGEGIPPENLDKIFNPFFTTKASGAGLGLSVSYGIVKEHDGQITVASEKGEGTTFTVSLPGNPD